MDLISNQDKFIPFHGQLFYEEINETLNTYTAMLNTNEANPLAKRI